MRKKRILRILAACMLVVAIVFVFAALAKRHLGRELTEKELKAYVYACVLQTFGATAFRDGWNGAENDIAPFIAREFDEITRLEHEVSALKRSTAYRVGVFVTAPFRGVCRKIAK